MPSLLGQGKGQQTLHSFLEHLTGRKKTLQWLSSLREKAKASQWPMCSSYFGPSPSDLMFPTLPSSLCFHQAGLFDVPPACQTCRTSGPLHLLTPAAQRLLAQDPQDSILKPSASILKSYLLSEAVPH